MKFVLRFPPSIPQALASLSVFVILLVTLAAIDERVHDKCVELMTTTGDMATLSSHVSELSDTISMAVRYQSAENAPMVLFATVGGVLFLFMVRT